jgi:hypothetical protein
LSITCYTSKKLESRMEVVFCLSVAILLVSARMPAQWSSASQGPVPSQSVRDRTVFAIVQFLSFACAGLALGLIDGFLTLELSGSRRNVGIPVLMAVVVPFVGVALWGTFLAVRLWLSQWRHDKGHGIKHAAQES